MSAARWAWGLFAMSLGLGGCGSMKLWPFEDGGQVANPQRKPENAVEYRCEGSRLLYVRTLEAGKSVWVILPDRQVRLDRASDAASGEYTNGVATLRFDDNEANLTDGPSISYKGCKR